ncbi:MAG: FHA domain-containing protein [Lachnospiraceae bacterium]|nr:FHA domain-containing protein [Lachnospiraceae bacterium]
MITRCSNGHWYDNSVNRSCPHCKLESEKLSIRIEEIEEDDRTISIAEADISLGEELGAIIGNAHSNLRHSQDFQGEMDDDRTVSFGFFGLSAIQPVSGWLVCMTGSERGKDYRLHAGKNFVGRSTSMDVVLIDDKLISRDRHCSVTYDPVSNQFFVSSEGGNVTYKNDNLLEVPDVLKEGDCITVGKTTLLFIPFCKEERKWEKE